MRQPGPIKASVTKVIASTSANNTLMSLNAPTLEIDNKNASEHDRQVIRKSKKLASYKGNFLGLLTYHYSEREDEVIATSTAQGMPPLRETTGCLIATTC